MLLVDRTGLPVGYTLVAGNEQGYEPVRELALADGTAILACDKGFWGRQYAEAPRLALTGRPPRALVAYHGR